MLYYVGHTQVLEHAGISGGYYLPWVTYSSFAPQLQEHSIELGTIGNQDNILDN
jgi:hypothetical protein